jgi:hypothetical protein
VSVDEECHGKEIGRAAWTETPSDKVFVDRSSPLPPTGPTHAAGVEKMPRGPAREAKAVETAAMQEIGVFDGSDEGEARFDAGCFRVVGNSARPSPQGRQADPVDAGKPARGLDACTARAKTAARSAAMAVQ